MIGPKEKSYIQYLPPYLRRRYVNLKKYCGHIGAGYSLQSFEECGCIFVHIPKTGGISVAKSLFGNLAGGHCSVKDYRFLFGSEAYESMFTFAFVRHPFTRLASAYRFLKQGGMTEEDRKWKEKNITDYHSVDEFVRGWVRKNNVNLWKHFRKQSQFLYGKKEVDVDFVGKTENINNDFNKIKNTLGVEGELSHLNKTGKNSYKNIYSEESKRIIKEVYKEDFENFGYE